MKLSVEIHKQLGDFQLHVQFDVGEARLALLGASGCGKSVTLKCIAGMITPDEGRIVLNGRVLFDSAARINLPPQKRRVGYLFQNYALFPHMTVRQNIAVAARNADDVTALLRRFQLEDVAGQKPWQLSGGQQQRAALGRILASQPEAILLDEPFSALDSFLKAQLEWELTETLDAFSGPVLWVSHDRGEVFRNCPAICVLDRGRSQAVTSREDLFRRPGTVAAARLSGCENFAAAQQCGEGIFLPEWNVTLSCKGPISPELTAVGIRACHVRLAEAGAENAISCELVHRIPDLSGGIALLRPRGAGPAAPLLRMELEAAVSVDTPLTVSLAPEDILLLK
ncbi:MAG: ATP-binding cassette domain-containing protein [Oscillibacter sp.]